MPERHVPTERADLADAFVAAGPTAPTLCEGWDANDLLAHLVVREHKPRASLGIIVPKLASWHDGAIERIEQRHSFDELVHTFRTGPPLLWKPVDELFNLQEVFVHHEDLRRGAGDHTPRPLDEVAGLEDALWHALRRGAKLASRGLKGLTVTLERDSGDRIEARSGGPALTITGRPGEIVLYLMGRRSAAQVELSGDPDAVDLASSAKLGI